MIRSGPRVLWISQLAFGIERLRAARSVAFRNEHVAREERLSRANERVGDWATVIASALKQVKAKGKTKKRKEDDLILDSDKKRSEKLATRWSVPLQVAEVKGNRLTLKRGKKVWKAEAANCVHWILPVKTRRYVADLFDLDAESDLNAAVRVLVGHKDVEGVRMYLCQFENNEDKAKRSLLTRAELGDDGLVREYERNLLLNARTAEFSILHELSAPASPWKPHTNEGDAANLGTREASASTHGLKKTDSVSPSSTLGDMLPEQVSNQESAGDIAAAPPHNHELEEILPNDGAERPTSDACSELMSDARESAKVAPAHKSARQDESTRPRAGRGRGNRKERKGYAAAPENFVARPLLWDDSNNITVGKRRRKEKKF